MSIDEEPVDAEAAAPGAAWTGLFPWQRDAARTALGHRTRWPHGDTGPARPHGLAFVTPEPPPPEGGRPAARR